MTKEVNHERFIYLFFFTARHRARRADRGRYMALDFTVKDIMHRLAVKFITAFLPEAKKPYNLKPVHQPELNIHGIASKASLYNIATSPKVIEEGMLAGMELIYYLAADGFRIRTPLFNLKLRVPGEYTGSETSLPDGVFPLARIQPSAAFRSYLKTHVNTEFDGLQTSNGMIAEAVDEATGHVDDCVTVGGILTIRGYGLKIDANEANKNEAGAYFQSRITGTRVKANTIAVNEPRTLKVVVPSGLNPSQSYFLLIITQSPVKGSGYILKELREMRSDFNLTVAV